MTDPAHPRIGLWGTFDLDNFGDVLYPRLVRYSLSTRLRGADIRAMSPVGDQNPTVFDPGEPVERLGTWKKERLRELADELDCVVVGGGDIIHFDDAEYAKCYEVSTERMGRIAPSRYFIEGLGEELERECPVIWNAVGVPFDFTTDQAEAVRSSLGRRPYVSVRDGSSRHRLESAGVRREIAVVPDPALLLPRLLPIADLRKRRAQLVQMGWYPETESVLVVQGNGGLTPWAEAIAEALKRILEQQPALSVMTVEPGGCHGDEAFAELLAETLPVPVRRLPAATGVEDLVAAIALSSGFIGSSLHGNAAALAYGRPTVLVNLNRFSKIRGLAQWANRVDHLASTPEEIPDAFRRAQGNPPTRGELLLLQKEIDAHFDRIADVAREACSRTGAARDHTPVRALQRRLQSFEAAGRTQAHRISAQREAASRGIEVLRKEVSKLQHVLEEKDHQLREAELRYQELEGSTWHRVGRRLKRVLDRWAPWGSRRRSVVLAPMRAVQFVAAHGWRSFLIRLLKVWRWVPALFRRAVSQAGGLPSHRRYRLWLESVVLSPDRLRKARREERELPYRPRISLVMPTFNSKPEWLHAAVASVMAQVYPEWELCIVDDGSTDPRTRETLREIEGRDPRIKVRYLESNRGISGASNEALSLATGEFVGFLDHDDELREIALFEVVCLLNETPDLDFVYSDEDKKEPGGRLTDAFFKPGWSPDLLLSVNYVTHFSVYRKKVVDEVGGFRTGYEGSQDYDLILRVSERTDRIARIPLPLYTWRKVPGSAASAVDAKSYAFEAGRRAIQDALDRRGIRATAEEGLVRARYRVRYEIEGDPRVQIIIPTRDKVDLLRRCVDSIRQRTTYASYEVTIIDNQSEEPSTLEFLEGFWGRVIAYPHPFNYSRMMNEATARVDEGDLILLLNNDIEVINGDWLQAMVEHAQRPEVAAVGARLLYPGDLPQHEGIIVGPGRGLASNVNWQGYFHLGEMVRNYSAVTGACMMIRPEVFRELGGFDEKLTVAYNDVDLCLRAREKGYLIVYTPYARLYHHEGATRGRGTHPQGDNDRFRDRWRGFEDPYWNPNQDFVDPFAPRLPAAQPSRVPDA